MIGQTEMIRLKRYYMTIRERSIFNHLIRKKYLRVLDPLNVSIIQIQEPETILIWYKDPEENYRLKQIRFIIQPSCHQFISDAIKEHRELSIEQIIE